LIGGIEMKVLKITPEGYIYTRDIKNSLEALQQEVEGYIQLCYLDNGIIAIVNEEGRLLDLPASVELPNYGVIRGDVIFARDDGEDLTSLTDEDIKWLKGNIVKIYAD
jgi:hypothetical protein